MIYTMHMHHLGDGRFAKTITFNRIRTLSGAWESRPIFVINNVKPKDPDE